MKKRNKTILCLLTAVSLFLLTNRSTYANQSKTVTYEINELGITKINYDITLQSSNPNTYITKYTLSTGLKKARNVEAHLDNGKSLDYNILENELGTSIEVFFSQPRSAVSEIKWTLSFSSEEIINEVGKLKELSIPGFLGDFDLNVIIIIPDTFDEINYYSLIPNETSFSNQKTILKYSSPEVKENGVFLSFGETQSFQFTYKYELKNEDKKTNIRATIALPPDYKNQKIFYENFTPQPDNGYKDFDGNYIAEYIIKPGESYEVEIQGNAVLTNTIDNTFEHKEIDLEKYLTADKYWETTSIEIVELAEELTKDKSTEKEKARAIYDYVAQNLEYNQSAVTDPNRYRLGALEALQQKDNAICQEYADLFVTLSRAAGIPTRMLAGYTTTGIGYDLPDSTLHAWAEFYTEEEGWITVDPTWESTSEGFNFFGNVGLNHFVLSIRGLDSEDPPLVLSFISTDDVSDNLTIAPVSEDIERTSEITTEFDMPSVIKTVTSTKGIVKIINNSNIVLTEIDIKGITEEIELQIPTMEKTLAIFPGETKEIEIALKPIRLFQYSEKELTFVITGVLGESEIYSSEGSFNLDIEVNNILIYVFSGTIAFTIISIVLIIKKTLEKRSFN